MFDFLKQLRAINRARYLAWTNGEDAGALFDAVELGGEVGEVLNLVKKFDREKRGWRGSTMNISDLADEIGDVLICLDRLARRFDIDLEGAATRKFNATSAKVGLPHRLESRP